MTYSIFSLEAETFIGKVLALPEVERLMPHTRVEERRSALKAALNQRVIHLSTPYSIAAEVADENFRKMDVHSLASD
jgi:hypothetical protein